MTFNHLLYRTPISGCDSYVCYVAEHEPPFWGCGETGAVWFKTTSLFRDIEKIIQRYPHRKAFYIKGEKGWLPNPDEPENIEVLIAAEEYEAIDNFLQD